MGEIDFSELGREIGQKVEKFVNTKEIKDLQENIKKTVETTIEEVGRSAKEATDYLNKSAEARRETNRSDFQKSPYHEKYRQMDKLAGNANRSQTRESAQQSIRSVKPRDSRQMPIIMKPKGRISGVLMTVFGSLGAVLGGLGMLISYALTFFVSFNLIGLGVLAAAFACTGVVIATIGGFLRRRAKRFKRYVNAMGGKDFYSISNLAEAVRMNHKFVINDLKKMIKRGWFKEGHLDQQETCFMLTHESYRMYQEAQKELEYRKQEEERLVREQELLEQDPVRKQLIIAIEEGKEYIRRIREINDDIPGEEFSRKLYRLEQVCTRIFDHVGDRPEKLSDIRKFMSYYLPTTLKLTEAYREFSRQPVQGENITNSKKEIEEMLDNINIAFEKMLDKLFEDEALDVSTDISVLSTLLAQEGLLEDEFSHSGE